MGVSLSDVTKGALDLGNIIRGGMDAYDRMTDKPPLAQTTTQASQSARPAATTSSAGSGTPPAGKGMGSVPTWVWLVGGLAVLWFLKGR